MNCYIVPNVVSTGVKHVAKHVGHFVKRRVRPYVWHGVTIVCVGTPVWLAVPPSAPAVAPVPTYQPADHLPPMLPPAALPWPGQAWAPEGSFRPSYRQVDFTPTFDSAPNELLMGAYPTETLPSQTVPDIDKTAVPEPSSLAAFTIGILVIFALKRKLK